MKKLILCGILTLIAINIAFPEAFADTSFGPNVRVDDSTASYNNQSRPAIAVDDGGNIYVTWSDERDGNVSIYFTKSTNGGESFQPNTCVIEPEALLLPQLEPAIAVSAEGDIYLAWQDNRNGNYDIYFAKSLDGGVTFGPNMRVDDTGTDDIAQGDPAIAVDASGNIFVAWDDYRNEHYSDIYFTKSTTGGTVFEWDRRIDDSGTSDSFQTSSAIAVDASGNIFIVWEDNRSGHYDIYLARSTNNGASFEPDIRVNDSTFLHQTEPSIAVDTFGNIYVAWDDRRSGNYHIYLAKSTDGGVTFGTSVRVDDTGTSITDQYYPRIAVDASGAIYVVWQDRRNGNYDIYFAKSTDGGASFEPNVRVDDDASGRFQLYPSIAADVEGNVYVTWQDDRNYQYYYDIYCAKGVCVSNIPPLANAGEDRVASAGEAITLNASGSYDPDGTIESYAWRSLSDYNGSLIGTTKVCPVKARGYAKELIELTVTDNSGATGRDTVLIFNRHLE